MKSNVRVILALVICVLSVAMFIYLVAIKDRISESYSFIYPILLGIGIFGIGLIGNLKEGFRLSLTFLIFIFVLAGIGGLGNSLLKTDGIISAIAGLAGAFYAAYLAYKKALPWLLRINKSKKEDQSESQSG